MSGTQAQQPRDNMSGMIEQTAFAITHGKTHDRRLFQTTLPARHRPSLPGADGAPRNMSLATSRVARGASWGNHDGGNALRRGGTRDEDGAAPSAHEVRPVSDRPGLSRGGYRMLWGRPELGILRVEIQAGVDHLIPSHELARYRRTPGP